MTQEKREIRDAQGQADTNVLRDPMAVCLTDRGLGVLVEDFVIEAVLGSPCIVQGCLTFDSFLGALAHEKLGDWREIPVLETDGLFHASAAIIEPYHASGVGWAASMRWQHDWPTDLAPLNSRGTPQALSAKRKREFGQVLSS